eukprot:IDg12033t1
MNTKLKPRSTAARCAYSALRAPVGYTAATGAKGCIISHRALPKQGNRGTISHFHAGAVRVLRDVQKTFRTGVPFAATHYAIYTRVGIRARALARARGAAAACMAAAAYIRRRLANSDSRDSPANSPGAAVKMRAKARKSTGRRAARARLPLIAHCHHGKPRPLNLRELRKQGLWKPGVERSTVCVPPATRGTGPHWKVVVPVFYGAPIAEPTKFRKKENAEGLNFYAVSVLKSNPNECEHLQITI